MSRRRRTVGGSALGLVLLFAMLPATASAATDEVDLWRGLIGEASRRFGVPSDWIVKVMRAESGGHTTHGGRPIRSPKGAIGLMQLMPRTWADMRARLDLGTDPDDPRDNILAGAAYLRLMYDRFGYPGLFAAYNAGPGRYAAYLQGQTPLPRETAAYLDEIAGAPSALENTLDETTQPAPAMPRDELFLIRSTPARESAPAPVSSPASSLFAIRRDGD